MLPSLPHVPLFFLFFFFLFLDCLVSGGRPFPHCTDRRLGRSNGTAQQELKRISSLGGWHNMMVAFMEFGH